MHTYTVRVTYTQITPQLSILRWHPKPPPVIQSDVGIVGVPGPVLLQEPALEIRQDAVHINQNPQPVTRGRGGRHVDANPLKRITEQSSSCCEEACSAGQYHHCWLLTGWLRHFTGSCLYHEPCPNGEWKLRIKSAWTSRSFFPKHCSWQKCVVIST